MRRGPRILGVCGRGGGALRGDVVVGGVAVGLLAHLVVAPWELVAVDEGAVAAVVPGAPSVVGPLCTCCLFLLLGTAGR